MKTPPPHIPWYKNHILLMIIIIPFATVCGSMFTIYKAVSSKESPVLESYYKAGVAPHMKTESLNTAVISATLADGVLNIKRQQPSIEPLILKLEHPTIAASDTEYKLMASAPNQYPLNADIIDQLSKQRWYLRLYTKAEDSWKLRAVSEKEDTVVNFN